MGKQTEVIDEQKMVDFFSFLQDNMNLPPNQAFAIIYYLQEELEVLPDNFELCATCKSLYDTQHGGALVDEDFEINWLDTDEPIKPHPKHINQFYCEWCLIEIEGIE